MFQDLKEKFNFSKILLGLFYVLMCLIRSSFCRLVAVLLGVLYMGLLYGLYVPDWEFKVDSLSNSIVVPQYGSTTQTVS